jgi:hypothetical protein
LAATNRTDSLRERSHLGLRPCAGASLSDVNDPNGGVPDDSKKQTEAGVPKYHGSTLGCKHEQDGHGEASEEDAGENLRVASEPSRGHRLRTGGHPSAPEAEPTHQLIDPLPTCALCGREFHLGERCEGSTPARACIINYRSRCLSRLTTETVQSGVGSAEVRALALKFW